MSCRTMRDRLGASLDGRLGADERAELEAHLATCPRCRTALASWEAAARALRASGPTPVPPGLAERAWRAAVAPRETTEPGFEFAFVARRALVAGAVAAVAIWIAALASGAPTPAPAAQDPLEVAVLLWTAEGDGDAE